MNKVRKFILDKGSSSLALMIISAILTLVPEDFFESIITKNKWSREVHIVINRVILCFIIFMAIKILYYIIRKNRKKICFTGDNFTIQVEYGNLFNITEGKVVISFDECFTTNVGEKPEDVKPQSICGQYLMKHPIDDIQKLISDSKVKPERSRSLYNNQTKYKLGTIVPNGDYLLMAFTKLDERGIARLTYEEYVDCLNNFWKQLDIYHGTSDVYIPVLGSKIIRFDKDLSQQELLNIIIETYLLSPHKLKAPYTLHIVCMARKDFSLNNIMEICNN